MNVKCSLDNDLFVLHHGNQMCDVLVSKNESRSSSSIPRNTIRVNLGFRPKTDQKSDKELNSQGGHRAATETISA